jgi:hypothetical protein
VGEAKEVFSLQMSGDRGKKNVGYMPNVSIVTRVEGKKVKHEESSPNHPFWAYILKISTSTFWVHGHFSWFKFGLHPLKH